MMRNTAGINSETTMEALLNKSVVDHLDRIAETMASQYRSAEPFPHIVIDDFLPAEVLERAVREFPAPYQLKWLKYDADHERKLAFPVVEELPRSLRDILYFLNTPVVLQFLERLTGIAALLPDPY